MANYVDLLMRAYAEDSSISTWLKSYWADAVAEHPPILCPDLVALMPAGTGVPASGNFASVVGAETQKRGGEFVRPWARQNMIWAPKGCDSGRIGLVGFSAGGGAVTEVLKNPSDANALDFVYYCDALHSMWKGGQKPPLSPAERLDGMAAQEYIDDGSLAPALVFAIKAAQGERCMVVTHSQVVPDGYPSTTETAIRLMALVDEAVPNPPQSGIYPAGLFGLSEGGAVPPATPEEGYWKASWPPGSCPTHSAAKIAGPWPVSRYEGHGNLIVVGFDAHDDETEYVSAGKAACDMRTNSAPAHIFQAKYVQREVLRYVLAERWKTECASASTSGLGSSASLARAAWPRKTRLGTLLARNPRMLRAVTGLVSGFGQTSGEQCFMEGKFSEAFTADEASQSKYLALGVGMLGFAAAAAVTGLIARRR